MKSITRLSLVLIMLSLFTISYLVTSVSAQMGSPDMAAPGMAAPGMGAPGMGAPGMGAPGMGAPGTVCIPESAQDQARKFGFKCMTPETIEIITTRAATNCREGIIKGHGKFRAGKNQHRASKLVDPATMMQEVMERTGFCVEKKSLLQCEGRMREGLHIDDEFCFPLAERYCGGTEEIRIKTDGTQIPYGYYVKHYPDLCSHYEIVPTQAAAIERLKEPGGGMGEKRRGFREEKQKRREARGNVLKKDETREQRKLRRAKRREEKRERNNAERQ